MSNASQNDWNKGIIEEYRAKGGEVGGMFTGAPLLLLTTTGAKSGRRVTTPLMYNTDGDRLLVFASANAAPTNPAWYHNLTANPGVTVERGTETFEANAVEVTGEDRDRLYNRHAEQFPQFAEYQTKTTRKIPVIALERVG